MACKSQILAKIEEQAKWMHLGKTLGTHITRGEGWKE